MSFWAGRRRRRTPEDTTSTTTLLPLSYTDLPPKAAAAESSRHQSSPLRRPRPGANTTTTASHNFLLGGNYFPGKDDKRRRKRHLRHQKRPKQHSLLVVAIHTFLALPVLRRGVLTVVLLYLLLCSVGFSGYWSRIQRRRPADWWWNKKAGILSSGEDLLDRTEARAVAKGLQKEQDRLTEEHKMIRYGVLEKLSPHWFHRDDATTTDKFRPAREVEAFENRKPTRPASDTEKESTAHAGEQRGLHKETPLVKTNPGADHHGLVPNPQSPMDEKQSASHPHQEKRTLQSMHHFTNRTACPRNLNPLEIQTTLVVQTSMSRAWVLDETCKRWTDPIVAVIVLTEADSRTALSAYLDEWESKCPHLRVITHEVEGKEENPDMYPVNRLRNLGLDQVETSHVLVVDVDFVPSKGLPDEIREALGLRGKIREKDPSATDPQDREAIVVPAFQRETEKPCLTEDDCQQYLRHDSAFIPHDFASLRDCVMEKQCTVFQLHDNWEGHHSTRSERWLSSDFYEREPVAGTEEGLKDVKRISCFDSLRYEPYVVLRWCPDGEQQEDANVSTPFYDERFHGYGKNKVSLDPALVFVHMQWSPFLTPIYRSSTFNISAFWAISLPCYPRDLLYTIRMLRPRPRQFGTTANRRPCTRLWTLCTQSSCKNSGKSTKTQQWTVWSNSAGIPLEQQRLICNVENRIEKTKL
jgi:hypothetical protein